MKLIGASVKIRRIEQWYSGGIVIWPEGRITGIREHNGDRPPISGWTTDRSQFGADPVDTAAP
jgi:hypothetical protein